MFHEPASKGGSQEPWGELFGGCSEEHGRQPDTQPWRDSAPCGLVYRLSGKSRLSKNMAESCRPESYSPGESRTRSKTGQEHSFCKTGFRARLTKTSTARSLPASSAR